MTAQPRRSVLRRLAVPVLGAAAAAMVLGGCGGAGSPGSSRAAQPPVPASGVTRSSAWYFGGDQSYQVARFCDARTGRALYVSENYPGKHSGGGNAYTGQACASGTDWGPVSAPQRLDGDYNTVRTLCDRRTGDLLYITEQGDGGGIAEVDGGCAPGAPRPGSVVATGGVSVLDPGNLEVRVFTDRGNGVRLYVSEAGGQWSDNYGGGIDAVARPTGTPGRVVRITQWQTLDSQETSQVAKFCDMGDGTLLYGAEVGYGGNVAALPGGCAPVAGGQYPPTRSKGPAHLVTTTEWGHFDQDYDWTQNWCDITNGTVVGFLEGGDQGAVSPAPGACRSLAGSLG